MTRISSPTTPLPAGIDRSEHENARLASASGLPLACIADVTAIGSIVFVGAIFGFFYAWVCSTLWGLDAADPRVAIAAMQAMNASVRNAVFFPAFFLTPIMLGCAGFLLRATGRRYASRWFGAAAIVYLVGGLILTMAVNVPMNETLADVVVPSSQRAARTIWNDYSARWQFFNVMRTIASGVALVMAAIGLRCARHDRSALG